MEHDLIRALEARLRLAMLHSDLAELEALLADDLVFVSQNGQIFTKADDLAVHRSGQQIIETLDTSEMRVTLADSTAVVVLKAIIGGQFDGVSFMGTFRYSRIWLRREGKWQVANAHCSPILASGITGPAVE